MPPVTMPVVPPLGWLPLLPVPTVAWAFTIPAQPVATASPHGVGSSRSPVAAK